MFVLDCSKLVEVDGMSDVQSAIVYMDQIHDYGSNISIDFQLCKLIHQSHTPIIHGLHLIC